MFSSLYSADSIGLDCFRNVGDEELVRSSSGICYGVCHKIGRNDAFHSLGCCVLKRDEHILKVQWNLELDRTV